MVRLADPRGTVQLVVALGAVGAGVAARGRRHAARGYPAGGVAAALQTDRLMTGIFDECRSKC